MFCRKCGEEIPDDSLFCPKCGTPTNENSTPPGENSESNKNAFAATYEYKSSYNSTQDGKTAAGSNSPNQIATQSDKTVTTSPSVVMVKEKPKSSKKALIIVLAVLGVLIVVGLIIIIPYVNRDQYPDFSYHLDNGTYVIDGYKGNELNIVIPDEMYGKIVTRIEDYAFQNSNVESVSFGSKMKVIGAHAFDSSAVKSVSFEQYHPPEQTVKPEELLDAITIEIGDFAFYGCKNLSDFDFPYDNYISIGNSAFNGCSLKSISLTEIVEMGDTAFAESDLENAVIGGNLGTAAFANCKNLKEFTIQTPLTKLTPRVFANCTALVTVNWNCNIYGENSIPQDAFEGCTSLRQIIIAGETATYPKQITEIIKEYKSLGANYISFSNDAFKDCKYFKDPAEPSKPVEQPKPQVSTKTAVDLAKLTYSQIIEKYGMPDYYVGYNAYYENEDITVGFSNRIYEYSNGSKCFNKNNNSRVEYIIFYGDKNTIIDSNMGNMHLGEGLDYYNQFMNFNVYDALEMGAGDHGASWYELSYQHEKNGVVDYYATIEFTTDTLVSYAVKIEYVGY